MYFSSRTVHRAEREDEVANSAGHPFNPREQADEAAFANTWMRNIRQQQRLFEKPSAVAA